MIILAGDIGGTKTNLALFESADGKLVVSEEQTLASNDFPGLEAAIAAFLKGRTIDTAAACFGVAGPVIEGISQTPNLPWVVNEQALREALRTNAVKLINDLEATAYGIHSLQGDQLVVLNEGNREANGNVALVAAGTGLGEAALFWNGASYDVIASEGGHADFAPRNELEMDLLRHLLQTKKKRISYERVLSGPGLVNIYDFLKSSGLEEEPAWLAEELSSSKELPKSISVSGVSGKAEICVRALDIFTELYGAQAGNLALTFNASGGVYLGGGIAPKIVDKLKSGNFMKAFVDKGRLSPVVSAVPVYVIMNPKTALLGAARVASSLAAI